ncbi:class II fructose-bisphosphate aldolase [Echinicola jeungdonensis]|uniref:Ketose-bisphosphate aldolase n=1 Tax=Echinicola jeungdonensis TaxID=709343 RepID=A0ABV5JAN8_9BACT|nr:class II fructose-bisphosphate aldolase [Echinicola jeungdonensis]MDN3670365.1 class II fructose-bisphosphate aldolase [Echinicola jeungdonensis]
MKVSPKDLYNHCYGKYGIAAINVFTMEQVLGVFKAASISKSPVIIQTTPVARDYANPVMLLNMIATGAQIFPEVVYALHLDHGNEFHIDAALEEGHYTSLMIDASNDSFEKNISRTLSVVQSAHSKGLVVEAELGVLSGVEDDMEVDEANSRYTQPDEVEEFVSRTGCDSLAIAVGTSHGAYKFSGGQGIQFGILKEINKRLPGYPLVLHGGSAVDPKETQEINELGGQLKSGSRGVSEEELKAAIGLGVCKVNIATDLRVLWTRVHREFFNNHPDQFDPIVPGKKYQEELVEFCLKKFELLGSTGKAVAFDTQSV